MCTTGIRDNRKYTKNVSYSFLINLNSIKGILCKNKTILNYIVDENN